MISLFTVKTRVGGNKKTRISFRLKSIYIYRIIKIMELKLDCSILSISDLKEQEDKTFWLKKSPIERLRAMHSHRQVAYRKAFITERLQRVLERS